MKKIVRDISILLIALLLVCCLVVGLTACGDDGGTTDSDPVDIPGEDDDEDDDTTGGTTEGSIDKNKFEAEYTDLLDMEKHGFRMFSDGDDIARAVLAADDCSNGYCVGNFGTEGCYIFFEIESDVEAEAELFMSVSMDWEYSNGSGSVTLSDSEFEVLVNTDKASERQQYGSITYDMNGLTTNFTHKPFVEYSLGKVTLQAGTNTIVMKASNTIHSSVYNLSATGPLVDYLRIETEATLSWTPVVENTTDEATMVIGHTTLVP